MRVVWSEPAERELKQIAARIAEFSPVFATALVDRLTLASVRLGDFPLSGRMVPEFGYPQLREVISGDYRLIYHVQSDHIEVIAVLHGARSLDA